MAAPVVSVFCSPTLLALKQAGLEFLLVGEAQAQAIRNSAQEAVRRLAAAGDRPHAAQASPAARAPRVPVRERQEKKPDQALPREAPSRPEAKAPAPAEWPAVWQERLKKTRVAPVVWTYWELGLDLCGAPDPKRRELFRDLLADLAHPPGTHSFWPVALPGEGGMGEGDPEANAPLFWEGARLLHSRAVMLMGSQDLLRALALPDRLVAARPFEQLRYQGRLVIVLPPPGAFIQEPRRMQALREFLRQALAPFA